MAGNTLSGVLDEENKTIWKRRGMKRDRRGRRRAIFFSDAGDPDGLAPADTGLSTVFSLNAVDILELGVEGGTQWSIYIPEANQPGYVDGWAVTYKFISDQEGWVVPLPPTVWMGLALLCGVVVRRKIHR